MRLSAIVMCALLAGAVIGCRRPTGPSREYAQAREKWTALLKEKLDGASQDPRADEVLALLARVDPRSVDAQFAAELQKQIESARNEARAHEKLLAEREQLVVQALEAPPAPDFPPTPAEEGVEAGEATSPDPNAQPDAGEEVGQPKDGMDAAEFQKKYSRCFEYQSDALVGGLAGGKVWGLKDLRICRDLHPGFISNSVLVFDGKIAVRPKADLAPKKFTVINGQLVPSEEVAAKKKAEAEQADAGTAPNP